MWSKVEDILLRRLARVNHSCNSYHDARRIFLLATSLSNGSRRASEPTEEAACLRIYRDTHLHSEKDPDIGRTAVHVGVYAVYFLFFLEILSFLLAGTTKATPRWWVLAIHWFHRHFIYPKQDCYWSRMSSKIPTLQSSLYTLRRLVVAGRRGSPE